MFNYNTTEWELSCPFQDKDTKKNVTGVKFLDAGEIDKIWPLLSDWIKNKVKLQRNQSNRGRISNPVH